MALLTLSNIEHSYGARRILDGASLSIEAGEKVGMVGRNGQGKTTLMRAMLAASGQHPRALSPDAGSVQAARHARIGYLSQDPDLDPNETLRGAAEAAFSELHDLHRQLDGVYERMATASGGDLDKLLRRQGELESAMEAAGGYAIDHRIDATLHGLGLTDDQFSVRVSSLSGGQKGRLALARLLLEEPDLLLLDEPTNHLDIEGRRWLEDFLADEYAGAVVVVSHDRWLLDRVVDRIVEVERGIVLEYPGNYHQYVELRRERQLTMARQHDKQRDRIRQEEQFIARYKAGQRAKQARGRQSRLERFKRDQLVDRPAELNVMNLRLPPPPRSGDQIVVAEGLTKRYGDLTLFEQFDMKIDRGERIGIIGPNGIGKSTLIKCLLGEIEPDAGTVRLGSRLSIGYYRQSHEGLDLSLTVWQYLQSVIIGLDGQAQASEQQARDLAGAFLFSGDDQDKALVDLSGGERSRAVLAGLVASAKNVLVLDEPTNHLDIPAAERLEQVISMEGGFAERGGTLLLISHDRALLEATCDQLIIFEGNGRVRWFHGRYSDWIARQAQERAATAQERPASRATTGHDQKRAAAAAKKKSVTPQPSNNPLTNVKTDELEQRIEVIERDIAAIDDQLGDPAVYADGERVRQFQAERQRLVDALSPLESEWTRRAEA